MYEDQLKQIALSRESVVRRVNEAIDGALGQHALQLTKIRNVETNLGKSAGRVLAEALVDDIESAAVTRRL